MTTDVLRVEANERVDLSDFLFAVDESLRSQSRHWADQFFRDDTRLYSSPAWIISGFDMTFAATQLTVTRGKAILGHREEGEVRYGSLTTEGPIEQVVDVSTFSPGAYDVYIRFELADGESGSRAFWNPQGDGSEFAQTIATRRVAGWSVRVELTNPGAEWFKIGWVAIAAGPVITGVTHQRDFYFEGQEHLSYQSQWSGEGGATANDRNADRATYGVKDLHTFTAAMRQCLEDIKGRGLRRWWERDIGGMNIGFDDSPVEDTLAVHDTNFRMYHDGTDPFIYFSPDDYIWFDRSSPTFEFFITGTGNNSRLQVAVDGTRCQRLGVSENMSVLPAADDQLAVGDVKFRMEYDDGTTDTYLKFDADRTLIRWDDAGDTLWFKTANSYMMKTVINGMLVRGLVVDNSMALSMLTDAIQIGDADFKLVNNGVDPFIYFDTTPSDDFMWFDRSANRFIIHITGSGTNERLHLTTSGLLSHGLVADQTMTVPPVVDTVKCGHPDFYMWWDGTDPRIVFNTIDFLLYDRSAQVLELYTDLTARRHAWAEQKAFMSGVSNNPASILTAAGDYSYAQSTGMMLYHGLAQSGNMNGLEVKALSTLVYQNSGSGDQSIGPGAANLFLADFVQKADAHYSKAYRITAWGNAYRDATVSNLTLRIRITDDDVTFSNALSGTFDPGDDFSPEGDQAQWRIEAIFYMPTRGTNNTVRGSGVMWVSAVENGAGIFYCVDSTVTHAMDLQNNEITFYLQASSPSGTKYVHLQGMLVEEIGGHLNIP